MDINTKEERGRTQVLLWSISEEGERVVLVDSFRPFCLAVPRGGEGLRELRASLPAGAELEGPLKYRYFSETVEAYRISFPGDGALASWVKRASRLRNVEVFEDDVRSSITYFHVRGIEPSGWVEVEVEGEVELENVDLRALRISDIRRVEGGDLPELRVMGAHLIIPSQGPTPSPKVDSIRAAAVSTPEGTDYFQGDEGEVISWLREKILEYDPDVIVWWRSNDVILPFIVQRASELGIDFSVGRERTGPHQSLFGHFSIVGRINLDAHDFVEDDPNIKLKNLQSALEWYGLMPGRFYEEFELSRALEEDPQGVRAFAEGVAEAMRSLWDRFGNYLAQVSRISSYPMDYALVASPGFRVEGYLMKGARKLSVVIPKRPKGFVPETYPGGMVLEPKPGVHENVAVLDFASMYPHIILNYNVSPDTLDPECKEGSVRDPEHGHCFSQAPDGLYKSSVGELLEARKRIKALKSKVKKGSPRWHILDAQEKAIKVMTNAIYGYSGWAGARWYRREVAESITAWGRNLLSQALKIVKQEKLNIFYGDTDSLFLEFNKSVINKIIAEIEKELGFEIKVDKVYKRVLFTEAKKRYAGLTEDGKLDIVGLEAARGDWCRAARELQREVALKVLSEGDVQGAVALVHRRIRELREGKVPLRDLVIWKGISRPLKAYKARPPHVELAMRLEAKGYKIKVGDQIGFVVVKGAGRLRDKVKLHYEADPEEIDREYYVRNQLVPAAARILKVFGVHENALIPKEGVASLFEF